MPSENEQFLKRVRNLERQLDKLATDFFSDAFLDMPRGSFWQPPTDVYETESAIVVRVEAPGLDPKDILLVLRAGSLLMRAVRRDTCPHEKKTYHQLEIRYGLFERVVALPENIRHEQAEAAYRDGFILLTIPKCPKPHKPRQVIRIQLSDIRRL